MRQKLFQFIKNIFSNRPLQVSFFLLILFFYFLILYSIISSKVYPIGEDAAIHSALAKFFLDHKTFSDISYGYYSYPPLFHLTMAALSNIFHSDIYTVIKISQSVLPIVITITWLLLGYTITKKLSPVLIMAIVFLFTSNQPMQTLYDGGIPNAINSGIIIPLLLICLFQIKDKAIRWYHYIPLTFLTLLLVSIHHVSILYWLIIYPIFVLIYKTQNNKSLLYGYLVILLAIIAGAFIIFPGWYRIFSI